MFRKESISCPTCGTRHDSLITGNQSCVTVVICIYPIVNDDHCSNATVNNLPWHSFVQLSRRAKLLVMFNNYLGVQNVFFESKWLRLATSMYISHGRLSMYIQVFITSMHWCFCCEQNNCEITQIINSI